MTEQKPENKQLIVALDTATDAIALAVGCFEYGEIKEAKSAQGTRAIKVLASKDMMARREANVNLVPALDDLFAEQNLCKRDIACVVCGRGPGSFTGVRIAVATAKGLAAGLGVPLFGVATPDALAWQAWRGGVRGHIAVLLDAMRGEVYPTRFMLTEQGALRKDPLTVTKAEELAHKWQPFESELMLTGDALYKYKELFLGFTFLEERYWRPEGAGLLKAFETSAQAVAAATPETGASIAALLPIYTRLSDAEENERKRLASGGEIAQGALTEVPASGVAGQAQAGQTTFRPAAKGDIPAMALLEKSAYAYTSAAFKGECWSEAMLREDLQLPGRSWWVCYQEEELVGFAGGQLIDGQMHVLDVVVHERFRRKGIAQQLLTRLAKDAQDLGADELTLEVRASNGAAQTLYHKLGLKEVGRRTQYYSPSSSGEPREDAVILTGSIEAIVKTKGTFLAASESETARNVPLVCPARPGERPLILAIESSCDETAAALIDGGGRLLSNVVASQTSFHARFGGVVPEIASRKHTEAIFPVVMEAMDGRAWQELDAVAVTYAPGLIGALVVGMAFAKGLCWATDLPLIKVNHLEGHVYANRFIEPEESCYAIDSSVIKPPFVIALLSGGNTLLVHVQEWGEYKVLGETLDDAIGEAYDKVAKALGLGYPGGPVIARLATEGNPKAIDFPRALLHSHDYQFSFSGLKTAVLTVIREQIAAGTLNVPNIAASFEQAVIEVQVAKALTACESLGIKTFCIGGGVAANTALRKAYQDAMEPRGIRVVFPPQIACTDNAAMIAAAALDRFKEGRFASLSDDAAANADLEQPY